MMPAVAAAAAVDSKIECYVCGGNHMARDCRNCWQCGSASHMAAECDKYSKMYHEIMTAHADCRSLTVAAAIAFDEGKHDDAASALAEMNTILTKTDDVVFDLFGPGPRCARCDDDEAAEWAFAERTIPAPWVIAGAEDAKAPPGAAEDPDGTVSQRAAFHDMHRPESRSLDIFEPPTPHTVPFPAQALGARIQKVGLSPPGRLHASATAAEALAIVEREPAPPAPVAPAAAATATRMSRKTKRFFMNPNNVAVWLDVHGYWRDRRGRFAVAPTAAA